MINLPLAMTKALESLNKMDKRFKTVISDIEKHHALITGNTDDEILKDKIDKFSKSYKIDYEDAKYENGILIYSLTVIKDNKDDDSVVINYLNFKKYYTTFLKYMKKLEEMKKDYNKESEEFFKEEKYFRVSKYGKVIYILNIYFNLLKYEVNGLKSLLGEKKEEDE